MIGPNESERGGRESAFSARGIMCFLEQELGKMLGVASDEAQQLYYAASEAGTDEEQFALLQKALKLDPGNVDALLAFLRHCPLPVEEAIEALRKIVTLGEQRLGPQAFKEMAGAFWGFLETRPYMRARAQLAETLRDAGRLPEAVTESEAMLELNPNDNQGMRYSLLASYLALKQLEGAARLFGKFDECRWNTVFAWSRVLERWLVGDAAGAASALVVARKQNPYTEGYLKGHRRMPKYSPEAYAPGSKDEAVCFAEMLVTTWERHPEALRWLRSQPAGADKPDKPDGRRGAKT